MGRVQVIIGRSGSGKSEAIRVDIAQKIRAAPLGAKLFWIVPQRAAYATERSLLAAVDTSIRAEVVHLHRLAERASQDLGITQFVPVNTTGKRLLLADSFRRLGPQLQMLNKEHPSIKFLDNVLTVFAEMSDHLASFDQVEAALESAATNVEKMANTVAAIAGHSLLGKLRDLCLLYVDWRQSMTNQRLYDPMDLYDLVAPELSRWQALRGATLYFDGFDDLSPRELAFVLTLAEHAEETVVSLCMDDTWINTRTVAHTPNHSAGGALVPAIVRTLTTVDRPEEVFSPQTLHLYHRLMAGCRQRGLKTVEHAPFHDAHPPYVDQAFRHPSLAVLEQGFFGGSNTARKVGDVRVRVAAAQNPRTEADGVGREIARLLHDGAHPGDVVVLVPDVMSYGSYLREACERYQIPYYMNDFSPLRAHPLARFILAALQVVEDDFSQASMVRLLKTTFCGLRDEDADWLESYLRTYEVAGHSVWMDERAWTFAWQQRDDDGRAARLTAEDRRADVLRKVLTSYLAPFWRCLAQPECTPADVALALWTLMQSVGAKKTVAEWMANEDAQQNPIEASLHEQAWQRMMGLLSDLTETLGNAPMRRTFLMQVIRSDIGEQSLMTIPAGIDQVLITEYTRAPDCQAKMVFLMGCVDGALPRRFKAHGLLHDEERLQFESLFGQALGYTAEEWQLCERFTVYRALGAAREQLVVTYPLSSQEGKEVRPSTVVGRIRQMYDRGTVEDVLWTEQTNGVDTQPWYSLTSALEALLSSMRTARPAHVPLAHRRALLLWFMADERRTARLLHAWPGLLHKATAAPLPGNVAQALYGEPLYLNVYQVESFASCAYQHFAKYGLRLQEEKTPDVTAAAKGTLVHDALNAFIERHGADVDDWRTLSDEQAVASMHSVFEEILSLPKSAIWHRRAVRLQQANQLLGTLENAAVVLTRHARYGSFTPAALELSFGTDDEGSLPSYPLNLASGGQVFVRGRVDRVDVAGEDGKVAFRVIDYKSSALDIDLSKVEYGLRLQLPVYAAVVERFSERIVGKSAESAGLLYIPILRKAQFYTVPAASSEAKENSLKNMRARGWVMHDRQYIEWMDSRLVGDGDSDLFKKVFKKDGTAMKSAPVLSGDDWRRLLERATRHITTAADAIYHGNIDIAPYQLTPQDHACQFCPYTKVCHIDKRWDSRPVRRLRNMSKDDVLAHWKAMLTQSAEVES